jgi:hypothetical protein
MGQMGQMGQMGIVMRSEADKHRPEVGSVAETDWLAFAYVAGELSGDELDRWTVRLAAGEVESCEAVGRAVELVQAVSVPRGVLAAVDSTAGKPVSRVSRTKILVAAAVCLVLVVVLSLEFGDDVGELGEVVTGSESSLSAAAGDGELLSGWAGGTNTELSEATGVSGSEAVAAETELVVPEWMIAALALPVEIDGDGDR